VTDIELFTNEPILTPSANRWSPGERAPRSLLMVGMVVIVLFIIRLGQGLGAALVSLNIALKGA
jgi:hypothetical protein